MKNKKVLDFKIDKLTNSIEKVVTGELFKTQIIRVTHEDLKLIKMNKWRFNWGIEIKNNESEVYKLILENQNNQIHGLISFQTNHDHILVHLIENAPFNWGKQKEYAGVAGNLMAFACKNSFERGKFGVVSFFAKTALIPHYKKTLNAQQFSGQKMFIDSKDSLSLVLKYFTEFKP